MNKNMFIKNFVSKRDMEDGRESCLMIALENARVLNKRDIDVNFLNIEIAQRLGGLIEFNSFIGLVNYLLLLDMIGAIFASQRKGKGVGERIKEILKKYGNMNKTEQDAIYRLRNCLVHSYGLADKKVKFTLTNSIEKIVQPPKNAWDGNYSKKDDDTSTLINPQKMINKIEEIYEEVKRRVLNDELDCTLEGGEDELKTRFTIIIE
jgi:hypothetical protein